MNPIDTLNAQDVLNSVAQGVYVTDTSRRIVYWNAAAETITGWAAQDIKGKCCYDNVLCHVDKDGHRLCGEEHCPLHRSIVTGRASTVPFVLFAQKKNGGRVPLHVTVAPVRDSDGQVVGGVETFRDLSDEIHDIKRARTIQSQSLQRDVPQDARVRFAVHYIPHDMIGGDYYAIAQIEPGRFGIFLGDVTGHGVPAALYAMHLSSLWASCSHLLVEPAEFARHMNEQLGHLIREGGAFAAAVCGVLDVERKTLRLVGAGNPGPLVVRADGRWQQLDATGFPLGMVPGATYEEHAVRVDSGDCLLWYSDGAIEITQADGTLLNEDGLQRVLQGLGYPNSNADLPAIEQALLAQSNCIRFDDDLTLIEARIA